MFELSFVYLMKVYINFQSENHGVKTDTALLRECLQYEENKT